MATINKNEKVFEYFQIFPPEVRAVVVDEMRPDDRCRFRRCSKQCDKQARASKKFMFSLRLSGRSNDNILIEVLFGDYHIYNQSLGFLLLIENQSGRKQMKYIKRGGVEKWRIDIDNSADLPQFAIEYFKGLLKPYQNTIKQLTIDGMLFSGEYENTDFGIERLSNLKEVNVESGIMSQIFSKLRHPLKCLYSRHEKSDDLFTQYEQIYEVQDFIWFTITKLNNEQFVRLSASKVIIPIGELTVKDIFTFIKDWQSGKVRENFKSCIWELRGSGFDSSQLFHLFGEELNEENEKLKIKQHEETGKTAELSALNNRRTIRFYTIENEDEEN